MTDRPDAAKVRCPDCLPHNTGTKRIYDPSPAGGPDWVEVQCGTCKGTRKIMLAAAKETGNE